MTADFRSQFHREADETTIDGMSARFYSAWNVREVRERDSLAAGPFIVRVLAVGGKDYKTMFVIYDCFVFWRVRFSTDSAVVETGPGLSVTLRPRSYLSQTFH